MEDRPESGGRPERAEQPALAERPMVQERRDERPARDDGRRRRRGRRGPGRSEGGAFEDRPARTPAFEPEGGEAEMVAERRRPEREPGAEPRESDRPALSTEQLAAEGRQLTEDLLKRMGFECTVEAKAEGDRVDITVALPSGEDLLTGRKGEVRQALQHLLNLMINRGRPERYHLQLEINEFWQRREDELRELARSLAEEAVSSGSETVTEYLNAQERRVVHVTLREDTRVKTYALGTGLIKRVAVAPADFDSPEEEEEQ